MLAEDVRYLMSNWELHYNETEPTFTGNFLLPWAMNLRGRSILDVTSGQGIEARWLNDRGFHIVAQDYCMKLLDSGYHAERVCACAETLPYGDQSFHGVLTKDALIFLSPEQRVNLLSEANRVLVRGGSLLIRTESLTNCMRVHYLDEAHGPVKEVFTDDGSRWRENVRKIAMEYGEVLWVEFPTTSESLEQLAAQRGFDYELLSRFNHDDNLAKESRWIGYGGFIAKLGKK
ncbi:hypothetical protein COT62_00935 [Candidatus Roizmanbacteria bacterium CG09_land_8_20_14_0_10_41_9]|uniref:Methyltransferase type 11 domain-containing protein n=1 Tax=Candidatus Roizmanbacteria bacterium CG09_land_8_20_14_0_10_41_9 TaxID=1974850 RepID=A0A2H0WTI6_9BACT|nr:MAG: hypothetical protein COT62_00935 [Candidatus Roizmanbacteria bacterium CG09_land_8_20_14_0_10_41_9]